jgi:hypothetical protein
MSYRTLQRSIGGLVLALSLPLLSATYAQHEPALTPPETLAEEPPPEAASEEPATNQICQPAVANPDEEIVAAPPPVEPPPPQVIQVQLPTIPMLAREDIELLVNRLVAIEQRMADQQENAMAVVVRSNHSVLIVAAILGGLGLLGILSASIILMRSFNRFSDVMLTLPAGHPFGRDLSLNSLDIDDPHPPGPKVLEQISTRFLGALDQLEKRIHELEFSTTPSRGTTTSTGNGNTGARVDSLPADTLSSAGDNGPHPASGTANTTRPDHPTAPDNKHRIRQLLEEGESLMHGEKLEEALAHFDQALALDPRNSDALIKRGMTLERLQRMEAALECYNRAIATNGSPTLAYLHKGAICNRLQRYREALECYERALQAEQKP